MKLRGRCGATAQDFAGVGSRRLVGWRSLDLSRAQFRVCYKQDGKDVIKVLGEVQVYDQIMLSIMENDNGNQLRLALFKYFGYASFRESQEEIIRAAIDGRDVLCVACTGFGKSLIYQLPALLWNHEVLVSPGLAQPFDKVVLVVCPLISLMEDQVEQLNLSSRFKRKVAAFIGTGQVDDAVEEDARKGAFCLVYATPEKLMKPSGRALLCGLHGRLALIAIDEAHCISVGRRHTAL